MIAWQRFGRTDIVLVLFTIATLTATACGRPTTPAVVSPATAHLPTEPARGCHPIFYAPRGAPRPERAKLNGPGLVLGGGGTDVDAEFVWIHDTIVGSSAKRGADLVVLRATGNNDYDRYIYRLAPYNSVRTLLIPTCSNTSTLKAAARIIERSGAVFFAGGNQADYVIWKDTPIQSAVLDVYGRGGVIGGTSAGEAILGKYVFDAVAEGNRDTTTDNAVRHPWERIISFTYDFLKFPALAGVITDQHFVTRNRFGRTAVFMARQIAEGKVRGRKQLVLGVGVNEASGIVVDKRGVGTLLLQGKSGSAFLIRGGAARQIVRGQPFISGKLTVTKLGAQGETFDFNTWCGREPTYYVRVDGTAPDRLMYEPKNPYRPPASSWIPKC